MTTDPQFVGWRDLAGVALFVFLWGTGIGAVVDAAARWLGWIE